MTISDHNNNIMECKHTSSGVKGDIDVVNSEVEGVGWNNKGVARPSKHGTLTLIRVNNGDIKSKVKKK